MRCDTLLLLLLLQRCSRCRGSMLIGDGIVHSSGGDGRSLLIGDKSLLIGDGIVHSSGGDGRSL